MEDVDMEQVEGFLEVHDRWIAPFMDKIKEDPDSFVGLTLVDTHKDDDGNPASMITPRALDDIDQMKHLQIREVSTILDDDAILPHIEDTEAEIGHMKLHLTTDIGQRIHPSTDLKLGKIPPSYY